LLFVSFMVRPCLGGANISIAVEAGDTPGGRRVDGGVRRWYE